MSFSQHMKNQKRGELRIIGAISIDLNGSSHETNFNEMNNEEHIHVAQEILKEFCSASTVHGVRYFMEPKRHWTERLWWMLSVILSVSLCAYAILSIWNDWNSAPVIIAFNDKTTSIGSIPFPAVTVCSTKKFTKDTINMHKFVDIVSSMKTNQTAYLSLRPEQIDRMDVLMHVCFKQFMHMDDNNVKFTRSRLIYETIQDIGPNLRSVVIFATWLDQITRFKPIFTGEGLCFTFNSLNSEEIFTNEVTSDLKTVRGNPNAAHWNIEDGYRANVNENELYPYRAFGVGLHDSVLAILGISVDDSHDLCSGLAQGFRISLHMPDELSRLPYEFIHIPPEQDVFISVKPQVITTSDELRHYSPHVRGCFFKSERRLRFFHSYSQQKCEIECKTNFTRNSCGCVGIAMPRDDNTTVCTMFEIECFILAENKFKRSFALEECDCLPDCTQISYDVEVSQASHIRTMGKMEASNSDSGYDATTKLFVSFKQQHFFCLNRTATYSQADFIASCGGLFGLFMGISLLSVIELIYFFTLRLFCKFQQQNARESSWA